MSFAHVLVAFIDVAVAEFFDAVAMFFVSDIKPFVFVFIPVIPRAILLPSPFSLTFTVFHAIPEHTLLTTSVFKYQLTLSMLHTIFPLSNLSRSLGTRQHTMTVLLPVAHFTREFRSVVVYHCTLARFVFEFD